MNPTAYSPTGVPVQFNVAAWLAWYEDLAKRAGLSADQEVCYRGHLCGLDVDALAELVCGPEPPALPRGASTKQKANYWRAIHRRRQRVSWAVFHAEEKLSAFTRESDPTLLKEILRSHRNRNDWWIEPLGGEQNEEMAADTDRVGRPRMVSVGDLRGRGRSLRVREYVQSPPPF